MPKTSPLRGQKIPTDVWDFLDSNVPVLIVNLLHGYITELEKQNDFLLREFTRMRDEVKGFNRNVEDLRDELLRYQGKRVPTKPPATQKHRDERRETNRRRRY